MESYETPTVVDFHNIYFNLFFSIDLPDFQVARIFFHWIETDFHELQSFHPDRYLILDEAHMTLLVRTSTSGT